MKYCMALLALAASILLIPVSAHTEEMDHSQMHQANKSEATGKAVINAVDQDAKSVKLTHDPMPEFGWPKMTMDLPVTRKVDLSTTKPGDKVLFTIKLGRDKKYRIIKLSPMIDTTKSSDTEAAAP